MDEAYKKRIVNYLENPRPVPGIKPTEVSRTFYVDPTWTLEHNIVDGGGKVMFQAGTKVNPFDYDKMSSNLLFFDASSLRSSQIRQALYRAIENHRQTRTGGRPAIQTDARLEGEGLLRQGRGAFQKILDPEHAIHCQPRRKNDPCG